MFPCMPSYWTHALMLYRRSAHVLSLLGLIDSAWPTRHGCIPRRFRSFDNTFKRPLHVSTIRLLRKNLMTYSCRLRPRSLLASLRHSHLMHGSSLRLLFVCRMFGSIAPSIYAWPNRFTLLFCAFGTVPPAVCGTFGLSMCGFNVHARRCDAPANACVRQSWYNNLRMQSRH